MEIVKSRHMQSANFVRTKPAHLSSNQAKFLYASLQVFIVCMNTEQFLSRKICSLGGVATQNKPTKTNKKPSPRIGKVG